MTTRGLTTNLFTQSDAMSAVPWTLQNLTPTGGQADPLGGTRATLWTESVDGAPAAHLASELPPTNFIVGERYIVSNYVKAGARGVLLLAPDVGSITVWYDLTTLAITGGAALSPGIEAVEGHPGWFRCWVSYTHAIAGAEPRFYVTSAAAVVSYQGNGSAAMTTFGAMIEKAEPGQTTPSPYASSGATAGTGPRDYRQNLMWWCEDFSKSVWIAQAGTIVSPASYAGPLVGMTANQIDLTAATPATGVYFTTGNPGVTPQLPGKVNTKAVWLRGDVGGEVVEILDPNLSVISLLCTLTTAWRQFWFHEVATASLGYCGIWIRKSAGAKVYASGAQIAQTDTLPDYRKTNSAPFNPSGAPRSAAI